MWSSHFYTFTNSSARWQNFKSSIKANNLLYPFLCSLFFPAEHDRILLLACIGEQDCKIACLSQVNQQSTLLKTNYENA